MAIVVKYSFLLISICLRSTSWADSMLQVTSLIGAVGNNIIIQCAADKTPQDGVYLYKQEGASKNKQEVFYYYNDGTFRPKSEWCRDKVIVNGTFPNFNVTVLNVKATDIGLYWCEFNLQDKKSVGTVTWLWIEESVEKVCSGDIHHHVKIFLIVCAVMLLLLCITGFIFVILKVSTHTHTQISIEKHKLKIKTKLINNIMHLYEMPSLPEVPGVSRILIAAP
uniref:Immunoglobulin V-set domain-containing protein n=1 Tax=Cyprinus carpio TaxID=7962 RepID=A0A8C2HQG4_CYPCA